MATREVPTLDGSGRIFEKHVPVRLTDDQLKGTYASQLTIKSTTTAADITAWLAAPSALGVKRSVGDTTITGPVVLPSNLNWDATGTTLTLAADAAQSMLTNDWTNGNSNIRINGLTLNANRTTSTDPRPPASWHTIYLKKITGLTLDNVTVLWPLAFGGLITDSTDIYLTNYRTHSEHINQDGIHFFDCSDVTIDGIHGVAGDDLLGISAQYGNIRNFTVSNVIGTSKHASLIRVNQTDRSVSAGESRTIESLHFDGIVGYDCANKGFTVNDVHSSSIVRDIRLQGTFYRTARSGLDIVRATESDFDVTLIDCGTGIGVTDFKTQQPVYVATSLTKSTIRARVIGVTDGYDAIKVMAGSDLEIIPKITYPTAGKASVQMGVWLGNVTDSVVHDGYIDGSNRGVQVGTSTTTAQRVRVENMLIKNQIAAAIQEGATSDYNWFHDNEIRNGTIGKVGANTRMERNRGYEPAAAPTATGASAFAPMLQKIAAATNDVNLLIVSDSTTAKTGATDQTGAQVDTWGERLPAALAAQYPTHTISTRWYNDGAATYDAAETIAGTGPRTINVWMGAVAGKETGYPLTRASSLLFTPASAAGLDLLVVSHGHNENNIAAGGNAATDAKLRDRFVANVEQMRSWAGNPPTVITSQNPAPSIAGFSERRADIYRSYAADRGYGFVDVSAAFYADGRSIADILVQADGLHPSNAGAIVWLNAMLRHLSVRDADAQALRPAPPAFFESRRNFLTNGNFDNWPTGSTLTAWNLTNVTPSQQSGTASLLESKSYSAKLAKTAAGSSAKLDQTITTPAKMLAGREVTFAVRMYIPAGTAQTAAQISVSDGASPLAISDQTKPIYDQWHWKIVTLRCRTAMTTLTCNIQVDPNATGNTETIYVDRAALVLGKYPADAF